MDETNNSTVVLRKMKAAKIIAIVIFSLIMAALLTAIISDALIVSKQIFGFIIALFASVIAFLFGLILMAISFVLVFGVYLLESKGFWPIEWARSTYNNVMADYVITTEQIGKLVMIRIVLLIVCLIVLIASIVALVLAKKVKKQNKEVKQKLTKAFSITALIMSILGIFVCAGAAAILSLMF